jgi:hypothetical protein
MEYSIQVIARQTVFDEISGGKRSLFGPKFQINLAMAGVKDNFGTRWWLLSSYLYVHVDSNL